MLIVLQFSSLVIFLFYSYHLFCIEVYILLYLCLSSIQTSICRVVFYCQTQCIQCVARHLGCCYLEWWKLPCRDFTDPSFYKRAANENGCISLGPRLHLLSLLFKLSLPLIQPLVPVPWSFIRGVDTIPVVANCFQLYNVKAHYYYNVSSLIFNVIYSSFIYEAIRPQGQLLWKLHELAKVLACMRMTCVWVKSS